MYIMQEVNLEDIISGSNQNGITEQKYLELADNFKEIMEQKDKEINKLKKEIANYKYTFCKCLGNITLIEEVLSQIDFGENILFAVLRHTIDYVITDLKTLWEIDF